MFSTSKLQKTTIGLLLILSFDFIVDHHGLWRYLIILILHFFEIAHSGQKNVTAWLDLRNKAAHGKYDEYNRQQVQLMHQAVFEFMTRVAL